MRSVRLPSSAVCIAFVLVMGSVQVIADIDGGIAADLAALGYVMYNNLDYIPAPDDPGVTNLSGEFADTVLDCAEACDALAGCNGASFYPDPEAYFGKAGMKNCWMKTILDSCQPPDGAYEEPLGHFLIKGDATCPAGLLPIAAPEAAIPDAGMSAAEVPVADGPVADVTVAEVPEAVAPKSSSETPASGEGDSPSATEPSPSDTTPRSATQDPLLSEGQSELEGTDESEPERNIWYLYFAAMFAGAAILVTCCLCFFFHCNKDVRPRRMVHPNDAAGTDTEDATVVAGKSASKLSRQ